MRHLFILLLLIAFSQLSAQTYTSSCDHDLVLEKIYRADAHRLAVMHLFDTQSPYKDSIDVPQKVVDSIANALYAVYNIPGSKAKDTLVNLFGFKDFNLTVSGSQYESDSSHIQSAGYTTAFYPAYFLKKFTIVIADTAAIASSWKAGNYSITPDDTINAMVKKYGFVITRVSSADNPKQLYNVTISALVNLPALVNTLLKKPGIVECRMVNYVGDGNYIKTAFNNDTITLTYRAGCGDCPAGCTDEEFWVFKVYKCNVELVKQIYPYYGGYAIQCPHLRGVMPVTLSALAANLVKDEVVLQWTALTEINMRGYAVERSADGRQFEEIATLPARNSPGAYNYNWVDAQVQTSRVYYRVKAIDKSGEISYTNIVILSKNNMATGIQVYPNPVTGNKINVQFNNVTHGKYTCSFFAVNGQQLHTTQINVISAVSSLQISLPFQATGPVMLVIKNSNGQKVLNTLLAVK